MTQILKQYVRKFMEIYATIVETITYNIELKTRWEQ